MAVERTLSIIKPDARQKFANMLANIEQGCISPVVMIAKKASS